MPHANLLWGSFGGCSRLKSIFACFKPSFKRVKDALACWGCMFQRIDADTRFLHLSQLHSGFSCLTRKGTHIYHMFRKGFPCFGRGGCVSHFFTKPIAKKCILAHFFQSILIKRGFARCSAFFCLFFQLIFSSFFIFRFFAFFFGLCFAFFMKSSFLLKTSFSSHLPPPPRNCVKTASPEVGYRSL